MQARPQQGLMQEIVVRGSGMVIFVPLLLILAVVAERVGVFR